MARPAYKVTGKGRLPPIFPPSHPPHQAFLSWPHKDNQHIPPSPASLPYTRAAAAPSVMMLFSGYSWTEEQRDRFYISQPPRKVPAISATIEMLLVLMLAGGGGGGDGRGVGGEKG